MDSRVMRRGIVSLPAATSKIMLNASGHARDSQKHRYIKYRTFLPAYAIAIPSNIVRRSVRCNVEVRGYGTWLYKLRWAVSKVIT